MSSFQMTCMILWQENINRFSFSDMYNYPDENISNLVRDH